MTTFWIITAVLTIAVATLLTLALVRGRRALDPTGTSDLKVYRDQLKEVERDVARGVVSDEDGARLRTEVSRRILSADSAAQNESVAHPQPRSAAAIAALFIGVIVIGGGYGLYAGVGSFGGLGAPGYGDLGLKARKAEAEVARATRPSQADAEAQVATPETPEAPEDYLALVAKLRAAVAERPDDLQGHVLLARSEAALGNYVQAYKAQEQIIRLKGDAASASDFADLADMMILAAGGYVSPKAETALEAALSRDAQNGVARYYGGLMWAQTGRPDAAFQQWDQLLRESSATDPWVPPITAQIEEMAFRAGVQNYSMPDIGGVALPGPTAGDVAASGQMSAEDRQAMITSMVARLSDRLATEGGPPEEWSRLIGAYGVLGQAEQAIAIWENAQEVFAGNDAALEIVREGARNAGITQ
jgi:cytochrome c-type biogenesis protein CcmH